MAEEPDTAIPVLSNSEQQCIVLRGLHACADLWIFIVTVLIVIILLAVSCDFTVKAEMMLPFIASILALAIVAGARVVNGSFSNDTRKGAVSASGATIAVRLWAICFSLLLIGFLASSFMTKSLDIWKLQAEKPAAVVEIISNGDAHSSAEIVIKGDR
ncbi:hypothetical protein LC612_34040 [Nostoc sp. CHAB 5834]|nr:hypothetical protein [Nostoc sp. CHAB 5834]